MGILNVTPDSFSDGGRYLGQHDAIEHGLTLLDEGADLLDLGGESTRPDATPLPAEEEQRRVLPVLSAILKARPEAIVSIDTYHASTARLAVEAGAEIVNDVSGGLWDAAMLSTVAEMECGAILMHTRGKPEEWRSLALLAPEEIPSMVTGDLRQRTEEARAAGIAEDRVMLDPGFGFGKTGAQNYPLLAHLEQLHGLGFPLLVGISRKGFLTQTAYSLHHGHVPTPAQRLTLTTAANTAAVLAGAHVLRVHDVPAALEAAAIADAILGGN
ncbi:dihydropteroate synthase [Granulicella sibirica]|nr:dihydropteroate synthase [Granulicella sibirica]